MKNNKFNLYKYLTSKPLPVGYFIDKESIPNRPISLKNLKNRSFVINCSAEEHFDKSFSTYQKKIHKIEKDFGLEAVGGGILIGSDVYDNDFVFTEETYQNLVAVAGKD